MKILVVGGGGREHAICWKLSNEKDVEKIYCAPGNPGIAKVAECVNIGDSDIAELVKFAKEKEIDITVYKSYSLTLTFLPSTDIFPSQNNFTHLGRIVCSTSKTLFANVLASSSSITFTVSCMIIGPASASSFTK